MTAGFDPFLADSILPDDSDLTPIHDREYRVRSYRLSEDRMLVRGAIRDQKPPGLYISHDPDPITVHHMVVELEVVLPGFTIARAEVTFESYPHLTCGAITEHYKKLEGLSIARGFSNKVRELFGGPRGCTHTTALLLAMGPVAIQSSLSMRTFQEPETDEPSLRLTFTKPDQDDSWKMNTNTCHEWAEDGPAYARAAAGLSWGVPVFMRERAEKFGIEVGEPQ